MPSQSDLLHSLDAAKYGPEHYERSSKSCNGEESQCGLFSSPGRHFILQDKMDPNSEEHDIFDGPDSDYEGLKSAKYQMRRPVNKLGQATRTCGEAKTRPNRGSRHSADQTQSDLQVRPRRKSRRVAERTGSNIQVRSSRKQKQPPTQTRGSKGGGPGRRRRSTRLQALRRKTS
jgi:hypothetical protein